MSDCKRRLSLVAAFVMGACALLSAQGEDAGAKLSPADAKRLVADVFSGDEKKASAAQEKLLKTRGQDRKAIWDALVAMPFRPPSKKLPKDRTILETIEAPGGGLKDAPVFFKLPAKYDGKTPTPVVFRFHGSGDEGMSYVAGSIDPALEKVILVAPQIPSRDRQSWHEPGSRGLVDNVFRHLLRNYNVDTDRVYLSGFSAGGGASYSYAQTWPHRVASFYAMGAIYSCFEEKDEACMDVLSHVPGFFAVGQQDTAERLKSFRTAEAYYKAKSLPGVFHFVSGKGHDYLSELDPKGFEYMFKNKRVRYPKEFHAIFFQYDNLREDEPYVTTCYWLVATKYSFGGTPCRVTAEGNTIEIQAPDLEAGTVLLNDEIVDLDQAVVVKLNGSEVANAKVERSVQHLLDGFDRYRDRGQMFWNRIEFKR